MGGILAGFASGAGKGFNSAVDDMVSAELQAQRDARLNQFSIEKDARQAAAQDKRDAANHERAKDLQATKPQRETLQGADGQYFSADHTSGKATPFDVNGAGLKGGVKGGEGGGIPTGLTSAQNAGRAALALSFGGQLDALGNMTGLSDDKKEPFLAANALKDQYVADGMHPGPAALKAFSEVMGEEPRYSPKDIDAEVKRFMETNDPKGPNIFQPGAMNELNTKAEALRADMSGQTKRPGLLSRAMGGAPSLPSPATPRPSTAGPQPGTIVDGFRFKGGNPNDPTSWESAN